MSWKERKELFMARKMLEREAGPEAERSKIWIEPMSKAIGLNVAVIYYLSRNGQLEHPHLMEVPISSPQGMLCLKDVINRLSFLRGQGMANMYSKDLSENDFIYPSNGHEYVLKGTQIVETCLIFRSYETISTPSSKSLLETNNYTTDAESPAAIKGRNQSLSSGEFNLYKAKTCREFARKAANASTQTEEKGRQRMEREQFEECEGNYPREFSETKGYLPFCSSSFGVLEGSLEGYESADIRNQRVQNGRPSGRMKASAVLMQLMRCGSSLS